LGKPTMPHLKPMPRRPNERWAPSWPGEGEKASRGFETSPLPGVALALATKLGA
jgi:hypothetical protein